MEEGEGVDHREAPRQVPLARPQALANLEAAGVQVVQEIQAQPGKRQVSKRSASELTEDAVLRHR